MMPTAPADSDAPRGGADPISDRSAPPPSNGELAAPSGRPRRLLRRGLALGLLCMLFVLFGALWVQREYVLDWAHLRSYNPPVSVRALSDAVAMTPYGERLFYVNRPSLEGKQSFNTHCADVMTEEAAVLGCYLGDRQGIYLFRVTDARLAGVEQVTAAHEMLHQAYDRLSPSEKAELNPQLEAYARSLPAGPLLDKVDTYRRLESTDLFNEMHSIFGTEAPELPAELEAHYARYFKDRSKVLSFHANYRAAFEERTKQIAAYDAQLTQLSSQIEQRRTNLEQRENSLDSERRRLDALLDADRIEEYNAAVPGYNTQVESYKREVGVTNELINQYNSVIESRNAIAVEEQELIKAQDSHAADSAGTQ